jgi:hypothetical protein
MKRAFAYRDGEKLFVVRPRDPQLAVRASRDIGARVQGGELTPEQAELEFNRVLCLQPYTFCGYYGKDRKSILDKDGWKVGTMKFGDSFVGSELAREIPAERGDLMEFYAVGEDPEVGIVITKGAGDPGETLH